MGAWGKDYVQLFRQAGDTYVRLGATIQFDRGPRFGWSVSVSGRRVAVGATHASLEGRRNVGRTVIYDVSDSGDWRRVHDITGELSYDRSGSGVALSDDGKHLVVGAIFNDQGGVNSG